MMDGMREMKVHVGPGLDSEGIMEVLNAGDNNAKKSRRMFRVAHALMSDHKDDRAEIDSVVVDEVTIDPDHPSQVHLKFTTSWSAYYLCTDKNLVDDKFESETATYTTEGDLVFIVPDPRRPASEC